MFLFLFGFACFKGARLLEFGREREKRQGGGKESGIPEKGTCFSKLERLELGDENRKSFHQRGLQRLRRLLGLKPLVRGRRLEDQVVLVMASGKLEDLEVASDDFALAAALSAPVFAAAAVAVVSLSATSSAASTSRRFHDLPPQLQLQIIGRNLLPSLPRGLVSVAVDRRDGRDADDLCATAAAAAARGRGRGRGERRKLGLDAREELAELLLGPREAVLLLPDVASFCLVFFFLVFQKEVV